MRGIDWLHMTHIDLAFTSISIDQCAAILGQCLQATYVNMTVVGPPSQKVYLPAVYVSRLRAVNLHLNVDIGDVMKLFMLPAIQHLTLLHISEYASWDISSFDNFLACSSCELETLEMHNNNMSDNILMGHLTSQYFLFLRKLSVFSFQVSNRITEFTRLWEKCFSFISTPSLPDG
jgi:hypothetical protein